MPYLQNQQLGVLRGELCDEVVHFLAWLGPWSPEIDQRDPFQISGHEFPELIGRGHDMEVGAGHDVGGVQGRRKSKDVLDSQWYEA